MEGIEKLLKEHPFFEGIDAADLATIAGCGANVRFEVGEFICREGEEANCFYAIRAGRVALELSAGNGDIVIQTLDQNDIFGWSWLIPPYRWAFDARAVEVVRAVRFDCSCLRAKCDGDPRMGYDFMKRFAKVIVDRLEAMRLQILDMYGKPTVGV
ncbi:MAG: cyclic nucleotide-binding domain-containing protein [Acidobacteria bacterium]|nr:cyclic nucleotide-binding domain-containing protein [Acidobacteriota bacterium]